MRRYGVPSQAPTVDQLRELYQLARNGRSLEELRQLFPGLSPGMLSEIHRQGVDAAQLEARTGGKHGQVESGVTAAGPVLATGPPATAGPPTYSPAPWQTGPPPPAWGWPQAPPASPGADALTLAVGMFSTCMASLVDVMKTERGRTPGGELAELLAAVKARETAPGEQLQELVKAFREGLAIGGTAAKEATRDGSPMMETVREVAAAITTLVQSRPQIPAPAVIQGARIQAPGGVTQRAPALAVLPRASTPAPAWDPQREVSAVLNYALATKDDPGYVAGVMAEKLPPDILAMVKVQPVGLVVDWLMQQGATIPAVADPDAEGSREWLGELVRRVRGEEPPPAEDDEEPGGEPDEPEEDPDADEPDELEEAPDDEPDEIEELPEAARGRGRGVRAMMN